MGGGFPGGAQFFGSGMGGMPGFEGMGGMPGMGGGGKPKGDNTKYYKLLDIDQDADEAAIKKVSVACGAVSSRFPISSP